MNTGDVILSPDCAHADDVSFGERMIIRGVSLPELNLRLSLNPTLLQTVCAFLVETYGILAPARETDQ